MGQRRSEKSVFELNENETQHIQTVLKGFSLTFERRYFSFGHYNIILWKANALKISDPHLSTRPCPICIKTRALIR